MNMTSPRSMARLYWLALGTFAIGTEGFMIAPLLPDLARDLSVTLASAGQLVTVFALTYALSSPVLTALTGDVDRRQLLIASMLAFAAANFVAWSAHSYPACWRRACCSPSPRASMSQRQCPGKRARRAVAARHGARNRHRRHQRRGRARRASRRARRRPLRLAGEFRGCRRAGIDRDRRAAERASPRHRRPSARREPPRAPRRGASARCSSGPAQHHAFGRRARSPSTLPCVVPRAAAELSGSSVSTVLFLWGVAAVIGLRLRLPAWTTAWDICR